MPLNFIQTLHNCCLATFLVYSEAVHLAYAMRKPTTQGNP